MIKNKKVLSVLTAAGLIGVAASSAAVLAVNTGADDSTYPPIVQKLAEKFKLNPDEVNKVFEDEKQARQEKHKQKLNERLDKAVADGVITEDQKNIILAKIEELRTKYQDQTPKQRGQDTSNMHQEISQWAKDNGIDISKLLPYGLPGYHHHMRHAH